MWGPLSRRTQIAVVAVIACVVIVLYVALRPTVGISANEPGDAAAARKNPPPGTFKPTKEEWAGLVIERVELGTFRPEVIAEGNIAIDDDLTTPVFSPYSGRIVRVIAKLGDAVEKGAPLIAVEASEFAQGQNDLITAVSNLKSAKSQLALAQNVEKRQHELYKANGGALKDWQQSQADLAVAQNNLRSAEVALATVRNRLRILGKSDAEIAALEAAPGERMDPAAYVRAPVDGIVTQRQVGLGQNIQSVSGGASAPVYTIGNLSTVWMVANAREADAPLIRAGMPVEVSVPAYPGRVFEAKVSWIAPSIDATTRRLPIRADVENPDGALKPMMFARFRILTGEAKQAPAVPIKAIIFEGDTARVWVAGDDGTLAVRQIQVGWSSDGMVEVQSGLSVGEAVVTSGSLFIDRAAQ
jgi:cobalt-zinc-cadmium efflux system membrane fusion protein